MTQCTKKNNIFSTTKTQFLIKITDLLHKGVSEYLVHVFTNHSLRFELHELIQSKTSFLQFEVSVSQLFNPTIRKYTQGFSRCRQSE